MIEVSDLTFGYSGQPPVFRDFDWHIGRRERWAILGPSGCGKTTLLYLLAGLLRPQDGQIRIEGEELVRPRPRTGLILQDYGLLPWASVRENAELGVRVRDFYGPDGTHAPSDPSHPPDVLGWLDRLGIASLAAKFPGQISGGQRQRLAIARTLALQPDLLLMDEPFSSLDAVTREDLQGLTLELCAQEGLTLVAVTHAIEEAAVLGSHILVLGPLPNQGPRIFLNPDADSPGFRHSTEYHDLCRILRKELGGEVPA